MKRKSGIIVYDGSCGVCSNIILSWKEKLQAIELKVFSSKSDEVINKVNEEDLKNILIIFDNSQRLIGADVYRYIFSNFWYFYPLYIFSIIPGFNFIFDLIYKFISINRYKISKSCKLN